MPQTEEQVNWEYERSQRVREEQEKAKELAKAITDSVNVMGGNDEFEKAFVEELTLRTHRTLQQSTAGLFLKVFKAWAEIGKKGEGHYDARNEATVKLSKRVMKLVEDEGWYLPLI